MDLLVVQRKRGWKHKAILVLEPNFIYFHKCLPIFAKLITTIIAFLRMIEKKHFQTHLGVHFFPYLYTDASYSSLSRRRSRPYICRNPPSCRSLHMPLTLTFARVHRWRCRVSSFPTHPSGTLPRWTEQSDDHETHGQTWKKRWSYN